ncbi:hypothetical protein CGCF413_v013994 [Colletotrichum fructicola]|nr:hypothetical protein CGCF413_v013994 [Colletotrichum fructicola]
MTRQGTAWRCTGKTVAWPHGSWLLHDRGLQQSSQPAVPRPALPLGVSLESPVASSTRPLLSSCASTPNVLPHMLVRQQPSIRHHRSLHKLWSASRSKHCDEPSLPQQPPLPGDVQTKASIKSSIRQSCF